MDRSILVAVFASVVAAITALVIHDHDQREVREEDVPVYIDDERIVVCDVQWGREFRLTGCAEK